MTETRKASLAEEIAEANSLAEIKTLLEKGLSFKSVTRRTERLWMKMANRRKAELKGKR